MGTRAAGGYVGMSEGWLGTVCALFLRSFNAATTSLIDNLRLQICTLAPCERRVVTRCRAAKSRAAEKTTAARCQAGCGCKLSEVKGGGSCVFHKGKGRQLTPAIPPGNARAAVRGRVGQESHRRNRTSEARLTREAHARITSQPSNLYIRAGLH